MFVISSWTVFPLADIAFIHGILSPPPAKKSAVGQTRTLSEQDNQPVLELMPGPCQGLSTLDTIGAEVSGMYFPDLLLIRRVREQVGEDGRRDGCEEGFVD